MRRRLLLLWLLSLPNQALQVQQRFPQRAVGRHGVLEDHCGLLEHPLGSQRPGPAGVRFVEGFFPFRPRLLPDHQLEELNRLL